MAMHDLASRVSTKRLGNIRVIDCPMCKARYYLYKGNALAVSAKLRAWLRNHLNEKHSEVTDDV